MWIGAITALGSAAWVQDGPGAAELRKMYDDVVTQLKDAQNRKSELSGENEKLKKQLADLTAHAKTLETRNADLEREAADYAQNTYNLRSTQAAWQAFIRLHPDTRAEWDRYLRGAAPMAPDAAAQIFDRNWPLHSG